MSEPTSPSLNNTEFGAPILRVAFCTMMPAAAEESFGKVLSNAAMNFSSSKAGPCSRESNLLESNGTGVETKADAREGAAAVALESMGEDIETDIGVLVVGLPRRLDSSNCANVGRADMLAMTEDSAARGELRETEDESQAN